MTIAQSLRHGVRELAAHSSSPRLDAEILLAQAAGLPRVGLITRGDDSLAPAARQHYERLLARRRGGVPVAYLTGVREFWSLPLHVTPAVLVPRPETETLVEAALEYLPLDMPSSLLDLGTGSGAIALAIAKERPRCNITAIDISSAALEVARHNGTALNLSHIEWREGCWFEALTEQPEPRPVGAQQVGAQHFDVIVSNPPYVADCDPALATLDAEPRQALTPGPTGREALDLIIEQAPLHLHAGGWLVLEHGNTQAEYVAEKLARRGFSKIRSLTDAAELPRVTLGTISLPDTISTREKEHL